ncbi:MAG: hypothetical protein RBU21_16350, partial [FCB group bacterium]|nr:hypothetical protein [FCB group bacterium]
MKTLETILPILLILCAFAARAQAAEESADRIESWTGKTVLVFTPHPDDDTFMCGGIMRLLAN